ncbi:MAG: hypothetical protein SV775_05585 [Thermodesulfobacteriota bacterium]|nr:hypothetical protein [Thermodesulfobacteriota bacterium]
MKEILCLSAMFFLLTTGVLLSVEISCNAMEPEPLYGMAVSPRGILFQVHSSGCTTKDDFTVQLLESHPLQLRLIRDNPDPCDAYLPYGIVIFYLYSELGLTNGEDFIVTNPRSVINVITY